MADQGDRSEDARPFVQAIRAAHMSALMEVDGETDCDCDDCNRAAQGVLDSPEMQAIAHLIAADAWLRSTVRALAQPPVADNRTDPIVFVGVDEIEHIIPRHVMEWAMSVVDQADEEPYR